MSWDTVVATECCEICQSCSRLLKHTIKLSNSNGGHLSKTRGLSRRINLNIPASPLSCSTHNDKENMGCGNGGSSSGIVPEIETRPFSPHNSPSKQNISPSKYSTLKHTLSPMRQRQPLEDQDPNSQDSGYGIFSDREEARNGFQFMEPSGLAPRKFSIEQSPRKEISPHKSPRSKSGHSNPPLFHSLSSGSESIDDGFTDILDLEKLDETENLPSGISSLLSGPIIKGYNILGHKSPKEERERKKPLFQRSQSLVENLTPSSSRARSCLFKSSSSSSGDSEDNIGLVELDSLRSFKRPEPPCEIGPLQPKRRKSSSLHIIRENLLLPSSPVLQRSFSETEATIKRALQRSTQIPDLIGDFTKPFVLPLMEGRHQDLKTISAETLADLMSGKFSEEVESFMIIDCRYPYEFDGGHIKGAKNIYTKEQMFKEFVEMKKPLENLQNKDPNENSESVVINKRNILIFHCEFSSERGPNMFRFLRNSDRDQNKESYPLLNYPELYLLHGGYKSFFEKYSDKCEPCAYRPMLDPNHETDLRLFRSKSKSWNGDSKSRLALRSNLKRLGL